MESVRWNLIMICFVLIALFNPSISDSVDQSDNTDSSYGWIRVCTASGDHYETHTPDCPMGVFLKQPIVPGCVCMHGTWVLHSTLCDNSPFVFYGEREREECYQIDFEISMFIYLGSAFDIRERYYVAPHSLTVFHEIYDDDSLTPLMDFHWPSIVAVNPSKSILASETGKSTPTCFSKIEYVSKNLTVMGHIWDGARGPTSYKIVDSCKGMVGGGYNHWIGTFNNFFFRSNNALPLPLPVPRAPCSSNCKQTNQRKRRAPEEVGLNLSETPLLEKLPVIAGSKGFWMKLLRRQKRYKTRDTVETIWDGIGFCMTSYWDPLLKFEMSTTEEMRCYPENKGMFKQKPA